MSVKACDWLHERRNLGAHSTAARGVERCKTCLRSTSGGPWYRVVGLVVLAAAPVNLSALLCALTASELCFVIRVRQDMLSELRGLRPETMYLLVSCVMW